MSKQVGIPIRSMLADHLTRAVLPPGLRARASGQSPPVSIARVSHLRADASSSDGQALMGCPRPRRGGRLAAIKWSWDDNAVDVENGGLVVWDVDGTLIPADLRWLRRSIAKTYGLAEADVTFPSNKVHGYTDESIVVDTAIASGVSAAEAEDGVSRFHSVLAAVMEDGRVELASVQPAYSGAAESIAALDRRGLAQTVLTGNLRSAAEVKLGTLGLDAHLDLRIGGYGSDDRDRFRLPDVIARRFEQNYGRPLLRTRAVVIGDAPNDIACARHAGFWVAVVTHRASRDELMAYEPDAILDRLDADEVVSVVTSLLSRGS